MGIKRSGVSYADFSGGDLNFVIRGKRGDCECSPGCTHCYALAFLERFGNTPEKTKMYPEKLKRLRRARFEEKGIPFRRGTGSRPLLFPCDFGDLFHPLVSDDFILEAFDVMREREDCDWLVLTKRPKRAVDFQKFLYDEPDDPSVGMFYWRWPSNVLFGITVENQEQANARFPYLAQIDVPRKWVSMEPLLENVDFLKHSWNYGCFPREQMDKRSEIEWIAAGGESGKNRRPFNQEDALWIQEQCELDDIRFFFKQGSGFRPGTDRVLDGREWNELPE